MKHAAIRFIYFAVAEGRRPYVPMRIKIGISSGPYYRMNSIRWALEQEFRPSKFTVQLIGTLIGGLSLEREIHQKLAAFHDEGEWFNISIAEAHWFVCGGHIPKTWKGLNASRGHWQSVRNRARADRNVH